MPMIGNRLENLALAASFVALLTTGCRVSLQLSPTTSAARTVNQEQPKPTIQDMIIDYLVRSINNVRERGQFNNKIDLITLPKAVMIGSAGGQRKIINLYDFPDEDIGHRFTRPVLDLSKKPIGPYKYFLLVYNPTTGEKAIWALQENTITHNSYLFFPLGTKDGWYDDFFLENGQEIEGNELFERYLKTPEDSLDGFT